MKNDLSIPASITDTQRFCSSILEMKYGRKGETSANQVFTRVATALAADASEQQRFYSGMCAGFIPGGRINASAGIDGATTMINCFVQPVGDTISGYDDEHRPGIFNALEEAAETMRRGGGVGYDFSAIRPAGARVKGTNSYASGPVSYMQVFDRMCSTVESAGARRGAQMGILRVDHPDILTFIDAKKCPDFKTLGLSEQDNTALMRMVGSNFGFGYALRGAFAKLSNFNISVALTDEFMRAVETDSDFDLVHKAEPSREATTKTSAEGRKVFVYRTVRAREIWDRIMRNTYEGAEPGVVFIDTINHDNNLHYIERINASNPCAEQPLPDYGCCDVGSVDIARFVVDPFTPQARLDKDAFADAVSVGVDILDTVLDRTVWPLKQQESEAHAKRRIGVGILGWADALAMLGMPYGSADSVTFVAQVHEFMRDKAYEASVQLAKRKGPFPLFDADEFLKDGTFASRLPEQIKDDIRKYGIRNSHLLSIAPTGTIATAFASNGSAGIEPVFAHALKRNVRMQDGSIKEFKLQSRVSELRTLMGLPMDDSPVLRTALQLSVDDHLNIMAAAAPYIDAAISKTINVPEDYPFDAFVDVYYKAWKMGLKGVTTYRPNVMMGAVLVADDGKEDVPKEAMTVDPDRRVQLKSMPPLASTIRYPRRPETPEGVDARVYQVNHSAGNFSVVVSHWMNGVAHPIDVYVAGAEQPRGIAAIAKLLSIDMREEDQPWIAMKLDSLMRTDGEDSFEMHLPGQERKVMVPSLVSGFAQLVSHRLQEIGALNRDLPSPMIEALFSRKEPKTTGEGGIGWHVDVNNPTTGDDFVLHTKELRMPDGAIRPYSVWLSGKYPRTLDGLAKLLSIDMRISDPQWILRKLSKLRGFGENQGHFMAQVPGQSRSMVYPSTVAYLADVLLHRFAVLGYARAESGDAPVKVTKGKYCPACHTLAVHKRDGCEVCDNCGATGNCG